jgi:LAO/AO transport system kinase
MSCCGPIVDDAVDDALYKGRSPFDRRALSQALSRAAKASVAEALASAAPEFSGRSRLIGITGPPGAGKSTLVARLAPFRLARSASLAVIAIDPSSPRTQGSILGDRIRMEALGDHPRLYIRSLPSRHARDGLTENLPEILATLEGFGFDEVLVETVGVGQTAYGVRALVDAEILVLTPGAGDQIQAMKAGIMETADLFVVNKADLPGAERLEAELLGVLRHRSSEPPPVLRVKLGDDADVAALSDALDRHLAAIAESRDAREVSHNRRRFRVQSLILRRLEETLEAQPADVWEEELPDLYQRIAEQLLGKNGGQF